MKGKKLLAWVLSLAMVVSLMPTVVFAENQTRTFTNVVVPTDGSAYLAAVYIYEGVMNDNIRIDSQGNIIKQKSNVEGSDWSDNGSFVRYSAQSIIGCCFSATTTKKDGYIVYAKDVNGKVYVWGYGSSAYGRKSAIYVGSGQFEAYPSTTELTISGDALQNWTTASPYITVTANPAEGGTVTGGGYYAYGKTGVELTATANPGYQFKNWSYDSTSTSNPLTITVGDNATYTANFEKYAKIKIELPDGLQQVENTGALIQEVAGNNSFINIVLEAKDDYTFGATDVNALNTELNSYGLEAAYDKTSGKITISQTSSSTLKSVTIASNDSAWPTMNTVQATSGTNKYATVTDALGKVTVSGSTITATGNNLTAVSNGTLASGVTLKTKTGEFTAKDGNATINMDANGTVTVLSGKVAFMAPSGTSNGVAEVRVSGKDIAVAVKAGETVTLDQGEEKVSGLGNGKYVEFGGVKYTSGKANGSFPLNVKGSKLQNNGDSAVVGAEIARDITLSEGTAPVVTVSGDNKGETTITKNSPSTVTLGKADDKFMVGSKAYVAGSEGATFTLNNDGSQVALKSGTAKLSDDSSVIGKSGKNIENPANTKGDTITVAASDNPDKDTVKVPQNGKVKIDGTEYENAASDSRDMVIEVTADGSKLTSGAVKLDKDEAINVGSSNTAITNTGDADKTITVTANEPTGKNTVTVPANGKVKIGNTEYDANEADTKFVVDDSGNVELNNGSATLNPNEGINVGGVTVTNTDDGEGAKDIVVSASPDKTVKVPKDGTLSIGEAKITDVKQDTTFTIGQDGNAGVELKAGETVTINGVTYTGGEGETPGKLTIDPKTGKVVGIEGSINTKIDESKLTDDFSYDLVPGQSVTIGKYVYTAPSGNGAQVGDVTIKGRGMDENDKALNPAVVLKNADGTVDVALEANKETKTTYTAANASTVFAMAANDINTKNIELLDNTKFNINPTPTAQSALKFTDKDSHTVNGVIYQAQAVMNDDGTAEKDIAYTVTYGEKTETVTKPEGGEEQKTVNANTVSVAADSKVAATMEANATINIGSGKVGENEFTSAKPFTATNSGASIIIDNSKGGSQPEISGNGRSYLTPIYGKTESGEVDTTQILGYEVTKKRSSGGGGAASTSVNVGSTKDGRIIVSPKSAASGETVTVTVNPDAGYQLKSLVVTDKDGNAVNLTKQSENVYTFVMPEGGATVEGEFVAIEAKVNYSDCAKDHNCAIYKLKDAQPTAWYHDGVHYCLDNGLMVGTSDTTFSPNDNITRGQIVTILWRQEGSKSVSGNGYKDVKSGAYYAQAIAWASENNIVNGYGNEMFGPDDSITREQLAAILYRYAEYKKMDTANGGVEIDKFSDSKNVSNYALDAMKWAVGSQIMNGTTTTQLSPKGTATRAQSACLMQRFITGNK